MMDAGERERERNGVHERSDRFQVAGPCKINLSVSSSSSSFFFFFGPDVILFG